MTAFSNNRMTGTKIYRSRVDELLNNFHGNHHRLDADIKVNFSVPTVRACAVPVLYSRALIPFSPTFMLNSTMLLYSTFLLLLVNLRTLAANKVPAHDAGLRLATIFATLENHANTIKILLERSGDETPDFREAFGTALIDAHTMFAHVWKRGKTLLKPDNFGTPITAAIEENIPDNGDIAVSRFGDVVRLLGFTPSVNSSLDAQSDTAAMAVLAKEYKGIVMSLVSGADFDNV